MRLDYKNILLKIIKAALILAGIIFFILVITSVPKDFDIRYFRGNYEATHSVKEIFALIQNNFAAFFNGDIGLVEVDGKLVKEVFKISFLRSFIVLFFSLITAIVLGLTLGYIISIISDKNTISNTLSMIPMSTPDVFTISLVQFFALYLFRNKLKFLGMGPIEHKGDAYWYNSIFPIIAISIIPVFYIIVTVIKTVEVERKKSYVLALRGKGLKKGYIVRVHMRKIILFNVLSVIPNILTMMFSSLIIVENLFYYRGLGYEMITVFRSTKVSPDQSRALFTYFLVMMAIFYYLFYGIINSVKRYALPDLHEEL